MSDEAWKRDDIQFPRLIAEVQGVLTKKQVEHLCESMDISVDELDDVIHRAILTWEGIKQHLPNLPPDPTKTYIRLLEAADDDLAFQIEDVAVKAGVVWRCDNPLDGEPCKYINPEDSNVCGECGRKNRCS